ncbi:MAG: RNA methyltransferase [Oscillospiraceae bacterium]|nr:RNA methyltransferase [Oscillospiraceae bacterium]
MTVETITSRHNALLTHLRKLASSRAYREDCGEYLGDGVKLLEEAVRSGAPLKTVLLSENTALPALPEGVRAARVSDELMRSVSPAETPQGALFTASYTRPALPRRLDGTRYLVLDGVQDPGNVGTILRTADAFECDGIFLVNACADLYNPKTVRATMGAIFRARVWTCAAAELSELLRASGLPLYGAALRGDTVSLRDVKLSRAAVAVGSEGRGLSGEMLDLCAGTVRIPMSARCESLNAAIAAAVLLWEAYRETT